MDTTTIKVWKSKSILYIPSSDTTDDDIRPRRLGNDGSVAAFVTDVYEPLTVNLQAFSADGGHAPVTKTGVPHFSTRTDPSGSFWCNAHEYQAILQSLSVPKSQNVSTETMGGN